MSAMKVALDDLYLAWRQAKLTLFFERRGVGLAKLASFEGRLEQNLVKLHRSLREGEGWFDGLSIGEVWVTPKRLRGSSSTRDDSRINYIGADEPIERQELQVQLRCTPSPQFAIVEVLFLWKFGQMLEAHLSENVVGYRLDHKNDLDAWRQRRWLFEYWPPTYSAFRTEPLQSAREIVESGRDALVLTADFASFYDTVRGDFLRSLRPAQEALDGLGGSRREYLQAVESLLRAHESYRRVARALTGHEWRTGIPIGPLTSRLIANLALIPVDDRIRRNKSTTSYRRYVDDLLIVGPANGEEFVPVALQRFFGDVVQLDSGNKVVGFDASKLNREGCEFEFQFEKVKVHRLRGRPGLSFLNAVEKDLQRIVSERRAFPDPDVVASELAKRLVRAESREGSQLRVFRDADRASLERFALNTTIRSLERISSLVDKAEAKRLVRKSISEIRPLLEDHGDWVTELDPLFQLLRVAASTNDARSAEKLVERLHRLCGPASDSIQSAPKLSFRGRGISSPRAWKSLQDYLWTRTIEAVLSSVTAAGAEELAERAGGVLSLSGNQLIRRAKKLAAADLRMFDREDDRASDMALVGAEEVYSPGTSSELSARFQTIRAFVVALPDTDAWKVPPSRLFLSTRPPSYFDVSSRILEAATKGEVQFNIFAELISTVNAIRGTRYSEPEGLVHDGHTVSTDCMLAFSRGLDSHLLPDPRLLLGNLTVTESEWKASLRVPQLSLGRLARLAKLLSKAELAAANTNPPHELERNLLLLPELSLPRAWLRSVAHYVLHLRARSRFGFIVGLEYQHVGPDLVENQVFAVLPGPLSTVVPWCWWKEFPADVEAKELLKQGKRLVGPASSRRTVLRTEYGAISVLICSELLETSKVATLRERVEVVLVPAWNQDTTSYDHLVQAAGLSLGAVVAIANNGSFSDCRAWAPRTNAWERELCRLVEPGQQSVVSARIPLGEIRAHHAGKSPVHPPPTKREGKPKWKPLPPDWNS